MQIPGTGSQTDSVRRRFYRFFQFVRLASTLAAHVVVELLGVCTKNLIPDIVVVKAAKNRKRTDDASSLDWPRDRRIFLQ